MAGNIGVTTSLPKTYKSWANGYRTLMETAFKKGQDYRSGIFKMETTDNWEDRVIEVGGIDAFAKWDDGDRASQTQIREGYETRFTQVAYGKELPIGRLAKKFQGRDINLTRRAAQRIGAEAYRLQQKAAFSVVNYGFSDTNTYLTGVTGSSVSALLSNGKRLFSTLHPCSPDNSTTFSNALSDGKPVGEAALEDMIVNLNNQLDDKGNRLHFGDSGYIWMVPLDQFFEASRIVGSDRRSGTSDNDKNVFKGSFDGRPIEVRWIPWLSDTTGDLGGSTTAHYLIAKDAVDDPAPLCVYTSMEFSTDDYMDDATKTAYVRGEVIFTPKAVTGRGIVGSKGDNDAYSS